MIKMIYCIRRKPGLSKQEFLNYWQTTHADLIKKNAPTLKIKRYVQSSTLDNPLNDAIQMIKGHAEHYDGIAELWWDSIEDVLSIAAIPEGGKAQEELFDDEKRFIDFGTSCSWVTEEQELLI